MIDIAQLLGKDVDNLLQHHCMTIPPDQLYLPGHDYVGHVMINNSCPPAVLCNMQTLYNARHLADTGYLSTLPVDQGVKHSAGTLFATNPFYFDLKNTVELAVGTGYDCVTSTCGVLAPASRCYAHRIPFLVKLNHNETLGYPNTYDQTSYASMGQAFNMDTMTVDAAIHFGSEESRRQTEEVSATFERAHELGTVAVPQAYLRNSAFKKDGVDCHVSADLTGQANHLAITVGAGIVRQKVAESSGGYKAVNYGYTNDRVYSKLTSENPIDLAHYQLANCYMDRTGLINSNGTAGSEADLSDAARIAVISKRAGGMRLILGREMFKKSMADGVKLINTMRDAYLDSEITIA